MKYTLKLKKTKNNFVLQDIEFIFASVDFTLINK